MSFNSKTLDGTFDVEADNLIVNESTDLKGTSLIEGDAIFLQEVSLANSSTNSIIQLSAVNAIENYSINLPPTDGTAGQILSTNGLGDASWLDPPSGVGTVSYIGIATVPPFLYVNGVSTAGTYTSETFTLSMTTITTDYGGTGLAVVGTSGQVLTSNGTTLLWATPTLGTLTDFSVAAVPAFLTASVATSTTTPALTLDFSGSALPVLNGGTGLTAVGTNYQVLTSNGTTLYWSTPTTGSVTDFSIVSVPTFLSATVATSTTTPALTLSLSGIPLPTSSGGTGLSSVGLDGQVLTMISGAPSWTFVGTPGAVSWVSATYPLASTGGANPNIYISDYTGLGKVVLQSLPTISSIKQLQDDAVSSEAFTISGVFNYPSIATLSATQDSIQLYTTSISQYGNSTNTGNIYLNVGAFQEVPILYAYTDETESFFYIFNSYQTTTPLTPLKNIPTSRLLNVGGKLAIEIQNPGSYNSNFSITSSGAYNLASGSITGYGSTYFITSINYITPTATITIKEVSGDYRTQYSGKVIISSFLDTSISTMSDMILTSNKTFIQNRSTIINTTGDNNKFRVDTHLFDIYAGSFNFFTPLGSAGGGIDSYIAGTIAWNAFGDYEATCGGAADIKAFANAKIWGGGYIDIHCQPLEIPLFDIATSSPPFCSGDITVQTDAAYKIPPIPTFPAPPAYALIQPGSIKLYSNTGGGVHIIGQTEGVSIKCKYEYAAYTSVLYGGPFVGVPPLINFGISLDTGGADLTITTVNPSPGGIGAQDIGNITINSVNMYLSKQTGLVVGPLDSRVSGEFTINTTVRFPAALYADSAGAGVNGAWLTVAGADWKNHYSGGTCSFWSAVNFGAPRIVSDNSVVYTKSTNVFIDQPTSGGSTDLEEEYALYVNGKSYFLDRVLLGGNLALDTGTLSLASGNITLATGAITVATGNITTTFGNITTNTLTCGNIIASSLYLSSISNTSLSVYTATDAIWQTYAVGKGIYTFPVGSIVICSGFTPSTFNGSYTVTSGNYGAITTNNPNTTSISIASTLGTVQSYDSSVDVLGLYTPNVDISNLRIGQQYSNSFAISFDAIAVSLSIRPENSTVPTVTIKRSTTTSLSTTTGAFVVTGDAGISGNIFAGGINLPSLTNSQALALDSTRNIISIANTGTGNNVLDTSPTISGATLSGTVNVSGLTFSKPVFTDLSNNLVSATTTGGGAVVLASTPSLQTSFKLLGSTTGAITFTCPPSFTDYNINFPATVGSSGQVLTSGGGGATMMSWTTPTVGTVTSFSVASVPSFLAASVATSTTTPALTLSLSGLALPVLNGGTGTTTSTGTGSVVLSTAPSISNLTTVTATNTLYSLGVTSTVSVSHGIYQVTSPNLANATASTMFFGRTETVNNGIYESWNNVSSGSASNSYTIAIVGSTTSLELLAAGTFHYKPSYFSSTLAMGGSTSGLITLKTQAVAGTYNWNFPITAGTPGQVLITGGGGSTAMSWATSTVGTVTDFSVASVPAFLAASVATSTTTPALTLSLSGVALPVLNGGTGTTTSTGTGSVVLSTTPTLVTPVLGAATGTSLVLSSTLDVTGATTISSTLDVTGITSVYAGGTSGLISNFFMPFLGTSSQCYMVIGTGPGADNTAVLIYQNSSTVANRYLSIAFAGRNDSIRCYQDQRVSVLGTLSVTGTTSLSSKIIYNGNQGSWMSFVNSSAAGDRYGFGQTSGGALRAFISNDFSGSYFSVCKPTNNSETGTGTFTDLLTVSNSGRLNVLGIAVLSSTLDVMGETYIYPSGTSSGTITGFLKPSLASGNEAYLFIGRAITADESLALSYRHNTTVNSRVLAFGWTGQGDILILNRNGNSVSVVNNLTVGGTTTVTGATTLSSTLAVSGVTTISNIFRSTVNTARYTMTGNYGLPNVTNTACGNWTTAATTGETMTLSSSTAWVNNLGRSIAVIVCYTGRRNSNTFGSSTFWIEANGVIWARTIVAGTDYACISAIVTLNNGDLFNIFGFQDSGSGNDFNAADSLVTLTILH
jgi:hypothetical protein